MLSWLCHTIRKFDILHVHCLPCHYIIPESVRSSADKPKNKNFIHQIIDEDLAQEKHQQIVTRFPPEPNGYLHIGHAKSIWLNFGVAEHYGGKCTLRYDDTNPVNEDHEYVEAIKNDILWLGYRPAAIVHASDYFDKLYEFALQLIEKNLAYVDSLSAEQIRQYRGTLTEPGKNSPYRERSIGENKQLFEKMRNGEFADGSHVLRAKIYMGSPNTNLRDPVLYRILHHSHQITGDKWCIYPMYDFAHGQSDAIEGVTHSLCTLEFEDHRALYDWFLENIETPFKPRQIEFSRLNINYTVVSKRWLTQLVQAQVVNGWDDPRMPTISGLRRRGYTPASLRNFIASIGITKKDNIIDIGVLEHSVRQDLEPIAFRVMAVLRPLRVIIENYPAGDAEQISVRNHPHDDHLGRRNIILSKEIYIEQEDFMEEPSKDFFRLAPDKEVRLRYGFVIRCTKVIKNDLGEVVELRCECDPNTRNGKKPDGRKVKGIIHWVSAEYCVDAEVRLYDRLFQSSNPLENKLEDFKADLNPNSLEVLKGCKLEQSLATANIDTRYQFERLGYFYTDKNSATGRLVFNRIVTLRNTWPKLSN